MVDEEEILSRAYHLYTDSRSKRGDLIAALRDVVGIARSYKNDANRARRILDVIKEVAQDVVDDNKE